MLLLQAVQKTRASAAFRHRSRPFILFSRQ